MDVPAAGALALGGSTGESDPQAVKIKAGNRSRAMK
jgi:hypothetical protein